MGSLKIKPIRNREYLTDNKCQNIPDQIPTEQDLDNTFKLDDSSLDKTLINNQSISRKNSGKTKGFHSSCCPVLSIVTGSSNQDQTLTNALSYFDEFNLLSSTVITIDNKTLKERLETSLARDSIISNNGIDDDKSEPEVINQDNPIIVNNEEMAVVIPNSQQVSLRDALEEVLLFDGSNIPLSHFIEGCTTAKAMLPTPAAQENFARLLRGKLSGEARKCIFGSTYATIEELIEKLRIIYAPAKSMYQLQGELGNIFMWETESVLSYAARIKEIADKIEDAHRLNNNGQVDNNFKQNLERDVIQCFIRGLRPELEICEKKRTHLRK